MKHLFISCIIVLAILAIGTVDNIYASDCEHDQKTVESKILDIRDLGDAKFELLIKKINYEQLIPLIENPECGRVMKQYYKNLPKFKKENARLEKIFIQR